MKTCPYKLEDVLHPTANSGDCLSTVYLARTPRGKLLAVKGWDLTADGTDCGLIERDVYNVVNAAYPRSQRFPRMRETFDHPDQRSPLGYRVLNVFDYVPGKTLDKVILSRASAAPDHADAGLSIAAGLSLCSSLAKLHKLRVGNTSVGFVHRDVRPKNIILRPDGSFVLLDLASMTYDGDYDDMFYGTLSYSPPEAMCKGIPMTPAYDVFSVGVTMYELATHHPPFAAPTEDKIMQAIAHRHPEHVRELNSHAPPALDGVLRRAMAKDMRRRTSSSAELLRELRIVKREYEQKHGPLTKTAVAEIISAAELAEAAK
ncbi:serine/threonine protein kinase [Candidatus Woesearchaeota archaeon]|nr:serine/threonine protein kinase [Candidatus Woesearchaeota archaeon]